LFGGDESVRHQKEEDEGGTDFLDKSFFGMEKNKGLMRN